jgi:Protein of unknown function (DUF559)
MRDVEAAEIAGRQFNRVSRRQLRALGMTETMIDERLRSGRLVAVEDGVLAIAPVLEDDWGRWMGATLTTPDTELSHVSACAAYGAWSLPRDFETVTRPGNGGPRRHGGLLVFRSLTLEGETTELNGVPITTIERTLIDLARSVSRPALARALREAVRLKLTTVHRVADAHGRSSPRRRSKALAQAIARYTGLPLERARSGAEVRAMEVLRDAGRRLPLLNERRAGEEADLSWARQRLIIEIDGGPFHLDVGEDARKQAIWDAAGWTVRRIPSDDVFVFPERLLALAPSSSR